VNRILWDVDTQVDFVHADGKLAVPDAEAALPAMAELVARVRADREAGRETPAATLVLEGAVEGRRGLLYVTLIAVLPLLPYLFSEGVAQAVAEPLVIHRIGSRGERTERVREALERVAVAQVAHPVLYAQQPFNILFLGCGDTIGDNFLLTSRQWLYVLKPAVDRRIVAVL